MLLLFNKSESLECARVVVLKLGAILFYSETHFKPLKLWKKKYREDLNRHTFHKRREKTSLFPGPTFLLKKPNNLVGFIYNFLRLGVPG